jgi:hypothetical protein
VVSGMTIRQVINAVADRELRNVGNSNNIAPYKKFKVFTWLNYSARTKFYRENLWDINSLFAVVEYSSFDGLKTPPCNSLSTLMENSQKGNSVRASLGRRYFSEEIMNTLLYI